MKAIGLKQPGGAEQLEWVDRPLPELNPGDLLIKVAAAGVNRTDILTRERPTDRPEAVRIGIEVAGTVVDTNGDSHFAKGDRVAGLVNGGGYAEYVTMPSDRAIRIPDRLSFEEAAAIPEVFLTAYQTLFWLGQLKDKETVLIHAGGSGVGTAAIQLAKQLKHATVIVTAGSTEKLDFCKSLGADIGINYKEVDFDKEVQKITDGAGVDLILDFVGASYWKKNAASLKTDGRWVLIGTLGGFEVGQVNLLELIQKRIQLTGTLLTPRSDDYKARLTKDFLADAFPLFERGLVKPIIDTTFPMAEAGSAHKHMEANKNIGKIILTLPHH